MCCAPDAVVKEPKVTECGTLARGLVGEAKRRNEGAESSGVERSESVKGE
jgi:hypothetical protein